MPSTLSIELGILCNNNCKFCYQRNFRTIKAYPKKLPKTEAFRKLEWGIKHGYRHVSFEGGEVTVHPDLIEIVRYARNLGYSKIGITTNGRRLKNMDYLKALIDAGVSRFGVSIHGPDAKTHDAITGHKRSFEQSLAGLKNILAMAKMVPLEYNLFTVVTTKNAGLLPDMLDKFHAMGVNLFVLQPLIYSKGNFELQELFMPVEPMVQYIRRAIISAIKNHYKIKLYNLPPCLFRDVLVGLELNMPVTIFREDDANRPQAEEVKDISGYVRFSACKFCVLKDTCPGLPISLMPQFDIAQTFARAIDYHMGTQEELFITGMEFTTYSSANWIVRYAKNHGFRSVKVLTGGTFIDKESYTAFEDAGIDEIVLVLHPAGSSTGDRILHYAGNKRYLIDTLNALIGRFKGQISILSTLNQDLFDLLEEIKAKDLLYRLNAIRLYERDEFHLTFSRWGENRLKRLQNFLPPWIKIIVEDPEILSTVNVFSMIKYAWGSHGRLKIHHLKDRILKTPYSSPQWNVLNWSDPFLDIRPSIPFRLMVKTIRVAPITKQRLKEAWILRSLHNKGDINLI